MKIYIKALNLNYFVLTNGDAGRLYPNKHRPQLGLGSELLIAFLVLARDCKVYHM